MVNPVSPHVPSKLPWNGLNVATRQLRHGKRSDRLAGDPAGSHSVGTWENWIDLSSLTLI